MCCWTVIELGAQMPLAVVCEGEPYSANCGYHLTLANPEEKRKVEQLFENRIQYLARLC